MYLEAKQAEENYSQTLHLMTDYPFPLWTDQTNEPFIHPLARSFLTDEQFDIIFLVLVYTVQISNIAAFIGNILNIAVFVKLGFSEPSNISLISLAATDLACVVFSLWTHLCILINFNDSILPFNATNVSYATTGGMFAFLTRTVAWITAFITFERCLCILVPLKVKTLITQRSTLMAMIIIVTLTFSPFFFIYSRYSFVWVFYPHLNATLLDLEVNNEEYFIQIETVLVVICGVIQPILAMSIVLMCTVVLVIQLRKISSWRKFVTSAKGQRGENSGEKPASSSPAGEERISQKEERLVRMVVAIATIFIVSNAPTCITLLCNVVFDEFSLFGVNRRIYVICSVIGVLGQSVSGSVNILIYYNMASKFRFHLRRFLCLDRHEPEN
ncbi:chemosensory receptor a [Plakobranchus ocellatus]|uniref:Chemosensory receptor a n=1 Tax=Plakobranchus ocellatus TaxID=259542 RepID=A0AAV4CBK1_9GAST|nr:chemosensory receptor a [Plakobranchus ocellatus]